MKQMFLLLVCETEDILLEINAVKTLKMSLLNKINGRITINSSRRLFVEHDIERLTSCNNFALVYCLCMWRQYRVIDP